MSSVDGHAFKATQKIHQFVARHAMGKTTGVILVHDNTHRCARWKKVREGLGRYQRYGNA